VSHRMIHVKLALHYLKLAFKPDDPARLQVIAKDIVNSAAEARKESVLVVESKIKTFKSDYMKNVFRFVADGVEAEKLQEVFLNDIELEEERKLKAVKVWADAGGFAPTIGILGAVLGLIHVMGNLTNTDELGKGIAVAFVATIYGVGLANLFFLPMANKIRKKIEMESEEKYMILDGALSIIKGFSPYLIQEKMLSYTRDSVD
ncbi:MAG: MotA/TolQ/ExbB proton channel family protein, partial [Bdellovibrionales bacterium]|nr:MotA/TolQ/ExbB proton channel family protein [Bdellovibrionales bacterium]